MTATAAGRVLVDTNVLVYAYDRDDPAKQTAAINLLSGLMSSGRMVLSTQCLNEFYSIVTSKKKPLPMSPDLARRAVVGFIAASEAVVPLDGSMTLEAIGAAPRHSMSFWDALIWAAARRAGASTIFTEDFQHGRDVEGIRYINPFLTGP